MHRYMRNLFLDLVITAYLIGSVSAAETSLVINEFMASNNSCIEDPQGQYDDWIEIYNYGADAIDIGGMYLTDNLSAPTKWRIPDSNPAATIVLAGGYLLIWADDDTTDIGLHANFKLDAAGEQIGLFDSDGVTVIDSVIFGEQTTDTSYGRYPDANDNWQVFSVPSPIAENISVFRGFVSGVEVSHERGFYDTPFSLTLASKTDDAIIYYTLDGTEPYELSGQIARGVLFTAPITIRGTTCLRAVATKPGWKPSDTMTHTYIFPGDVVRQSPSGQSPGPNWPTGSVNGQIADYGMDPDVVNDPRYSAQMRDALLAIPSISLVTNLENLFDRSKGIYVNASREGRSWERPVSVELLNRDDREGFQIDAGIRIRGGFSRTGNNPKHSFRLFFRGEYGQSKLRFPLFDDEGVDEFDNLDLRTAQNYAWSLASSNPGHKNTFIREVFCRDIQREMGQPYTRSRYYHLYINGQYWGL
ncbi:MAG: lamin tail domain-containing protein, partial [Desulfobacteraceae bacterium]|nr:lamin tail domain-containing protein [Desulfobacteraceae bacterium]